MIASKLNGQYGIAAGVEILPESATAVLPAAKENPTGEDASL